MDTPHAFFPHWQRELLQAIRLPFWFACFWAVVGTAWRPLPASVGLITLFLGLLLVMEWASRRLMGKRVPKDEPAEPADEAVRQQIIRTQTAEGKERLDGTFWAEFSADAMTTTIHIPFCPAFDRVPAVQAFPLDDTDVQLRITSQKTFGVRVDVKRNSREIDRLRFAVIAEG
ncbi:MAG: hypothetical protein LBI05_08735 [Planctomycetaceae bacterium]|jgi:hypothetical protein|nr:hypothetical protein [Planctomycetaceae bacterium]